MASRIQVKGMSCQHCVMSVKKALGKIEGIQSIEVNLETGEVRFQNTKGAAPEKIRDAISEAGYEVVSQSGA